jgi:hypothetical protein
LLYLFKRDIISLKEILNNFINGFKKVKVYQLSKLSKWNIKDKTILLFEPNHYHYECSPGYAKYFVDLGYNVDVLMKKQGKDSFYFFENKDKIRLFIYDNLKQIRNYAKVLRSHFRSYSYIVIQTLSTKTFGTISKLGLNRNGKVIYIFHFTYYYKILHFSSIKNKNRVWTLGNFSVGLQVVPFYIGNLKLKNKNKRTRFFTVSTVSRQYNYLIAAFEKLKDNNFDFDVIVVGKVKRFSTKNISEKLKDNFIFNYKVNYETLYKLVYSSDYIIITLDPDDKKNRIFKNKKVTGSAQLSLGFIKPALINKYFQDKYDMNEENSFPFDKKNIYNTLKKAVLFNNENYKKMQLNLINLANKAKEKSMINIKKTL